MKRTNVGFMVGLASLAMLASCWLVSAKKRFWWDELNTVTVISDPSWRHMVQAIADQSDAAPPMYHSALWLWTRVFTTSELGTRMFSALGMAVALALVWRVLAKTYGPLAAAVGTLSTFCLSTLVLLQASEARFYGFFMALCALALTLYDRLGRRDRPSAPLLAGQALVHGALALTHTYGLLFSAATLGALLLRDRATGRFQPRVYGSVLLGWLAFAAWLPAFLWQAQLGRPHSWIPVPDLAGLLKAYMFNSPWLGVLGVIAALGWATRRRHARETRGVPHSRAGERSLLIWAGCMLTVPLVGWTISRALTPIFQDRYVLPAVLGVAVLLTAAAFRALGPAPGRPLRLLATLYLAGLVAAPVVYGALVRPQGYPQLQDEALGYPGLPIATESPHLFFPRYHYAAHPSRYHFIVDLETALDPKSFIAEAPDTKVMIALKRNYPHLPITDSHDFLAAHPRFLLVDEDHRGWSERRLEPSAAYSVRLLGATDGGRLYLVEALGR